MTAQADYAELQVTTNFSFLNGGAHPHELVVQAKALGLEAIAVADRNTLAGVVRAHAAAKKVGIKLVVGARLELDDAPDLLCFPTDRKAYGRLSRLLSLGQGRAEKGACHLSLEDVADHAKGQIFIALPPASWDWREALAPSHAGFSGWHDPALATADANQGMCASSNVISFQWRARGWRAYRAIKHLRRHCRRPSKMC